ncbi:hypothetical protein [Streptomyces sp. SPB074]|uniref:hypothetical protein n=1 Tax=Streptomyces sp. (strain SPB074) TaxID=465543 RepID=UPI00017FEBC0|nr:hypothetical protein [Streptomyces sp. SPB074]EDY44574.1 hypothetical protein SSBG_02536 [Streptomyces sp. SPB074]
MNRFAKASFVVTAGVVMAMGSQGFASAQVGVDTRQGTTFIPLGKGGEAEWNDYYEPEPSNDADSYWVRDLKKDGHGIFIRVDHPNGQTYFKAFNQGYGGGGLEFKPANLPNGHTEWMTICLSEKNKPIQSTCAQTSITE